MEALSDMTMAQLSYRKGEVKETISQSEQAMSSMIHDCVFKGTKKPNEDYMMQLSLRMIGLKFTLEQIKLRQHFILVENEEERVAAKIASPYGRAEIVA